MKKLTGFATETSKDQIDTYKGTFTKDLVNVDFLKLVKHISDYVYSTAEYKNMPEANGGYD